MNITFNKDKFIKRLPIIIAVLALLISSTTLLTRPKQLQTVLVDSEVVVKKLSQKLASRHGKVTNQQMASAVAALRVKLAEYANYQGKILMTKRSILAGDLTDETQAIIDFLFADVGVAARGQARGQEKRQVGGNDGIS